MKTPTDDPLKTLLANTFNAGRVFGLREAARICAMADVYERSTTTDVLNQAADRLEADATKEKGSK